jgi:hypothetical protein
MALTPNYGPLYQGVSQFGTSPAAQQSGRSWYDPNRMAERKYRTEERAARNPQTKGSSGGGGGGGTVEAPKPLFTNATTGVQYFFTPMDAGAGMAASTYGRGRVGALGGNIEPTITAYDPRTGMSNKQNIGDVDESILRQMFPVAPAAILNMGPRTRGTDNARKSLLSGLYAPNRRLGI